jgi:CheY-like chemotaxis protein
VLLVVVDEPAHRALFNRYLANTPHHVVFSHDGEDGFDRFAEVKPDLIIAHVTAPRLDGTILCQLIRQQPRGDVVPFVLLGEELKDPKIAKSRAEIVGADGVLPFPFDRRQLIEKITPLLAFGRPEASILPPDDEEDSEVMEAPQIEAPSRSSSSTELAALGEELADVAQAAEQEGEQQSADLILPADDHAEAPIQVAPRALPEAQDTVVSFQNPYTNAELSQRPPIHSEIPDAEPPAVVDEIERETHIEDKPTTPFESNRPRLFIDGRREQARDPAREPTFDELPADDSRKQLLEEPSLSSIGSVPRVPNHSVESSEKARMLHEPSLSGTPSSSAQSAHRDNGSRRGLDESQLGKRLAKRVRTLHRMLDQVDYYQLLGVDENASPEAMRRAYFDLSLEFHPDRFFLLRSGDLKEKIYAIYRRITDAYAVLTDERRRASYDGVEREPEAPVRTLDVSVRDAKAKKLVELAKAAYQDGDLRSARLHLHLAQGYEADNTQLKAAIENVARMSRPA